MLKTQLFEEITLLGQYQVRKADLGEMQVVLCTTLFLPASLPPANISDEKVSLTDICKTVTQLGISHLIYYNEVFWGCPVAL